MKFTINPYTRQPEIELDESDVNDALKIKATMETEGWQILQREWKKLRETLISDTKKSAMTRAKRENLSGMVASLNYLDQVLDTPDQIVKSVKSILELQKENLQNDGRNAEDD